MHAALPVILLFSVSALAQVVPQAHKSDCLQANIRGQVNGGESFSQSLGNGLVMNLGPLKDDWGWQVTISPVGSNDDWAYPVNPPLRFGNSEYLGTGYSESAREVLSYKHEIHFPLNNAEYVEISKLADDALWPYQSKQPDKAAESYLDALKKLKTGTLIISALDYDKYGPPEKVRWMKFTAVVIVPQGFRGNTGLNWKAGSCSPKLDFSKKHPAN